MGLMDILVEFPIILVDHTSDMVNILLNSLITMEMQIMISEMRIQISVEVSLVMMMISRLVMYHEYSQVQCRSSISSIKQQKHEPISVGI